MMLRKVARKNVFGAHEDISRCHCNETVLFVTGDYVLVSQGTSWQTSQKVLVGLGESGPPK